MSVKYIHTICGSVAFKAYRLMNGDDLRLSSYFIINGVKPKNGSEIICGSCGRRLREKPVAFNGIIGSQINWKLREEVLKNEAARRKLDKLTDDGK